MAQQRRRFPAQEKMAILRRHLVEKVPVSDPCDEFRLAPNLFYRWQKEFFENGAAVFEHENGTELRYLRDRGEALQTKLARRRTASPSLAPTPSALWRPSDAPPQATHSRGNAAWHSPVSLAPLLPA